MSDAGLNFYRGLANVAAYIVFVAAIVLACYVWHQVSWVWRMR